MFSSVKVWQTCKVEQQFTFWRGGSPAAALAPVFGARGVQPDAGIAATPSGRATNASVISTNHVRHISIGATE